MINSHQFQQAAKKFRAGRITLQEFTDLVFVESIATKSPETLQPDQQPPRGRPVQSPLPKPLPKRPKETHKGDFGRVLVIGGAEGMAGSISLTGLAALRSGSGLVKVAVPKSIQGEVGSLNPCLMTIGCPVENDHFHGVAEKVLSHHAEWADVVAIGPGMGRGDAQMWILKKLYAEIAQPMVIDADGLNALADEQVDLAQHEGQRVLTPHPGEFQRLTGSQMTNRAEMEAAATTLADHANAVVVLKGHRTLVTDGQQIYRNETGNPGMATAGSGDVLTGVITSLIGQGLSVFDAATLGVHLHGVAGDFAAEAVGETSLIASDIIEFLAPAFKSHTQAGNGTIGF